MDWIEKLVGIAPDGGSGVWEMVLGWIIASFIVCLALLRKRSRKLERRLGA